jgi:hypothetical protein
MLAQPPAAASVGNAMASKQAQIAEINKQLKIATSPRFAEVPNIDKEIARLERQLKQLTESPFAKPDTKDYTPASLAAFAVSGDYADLVPKAGKADKEPSLFSAINPSDYTPDSVRAFALSKNYGDLVPKAGKADSPISNVNPNDFTPASVQKFALSRNYGDLVLKPVIAAPRPEPAPSITNIVDPTNPNQMIAIDAKRYRGGGVGSPGVIGVGGKEPGAALRVNKVEAGKTQLADDLENLRNSFDTLDKLRAIPSTERGKLSNISSAIASSRVGQLTGQALATEAQVERDVINSARSRLVNSIKNATGMSAQQLNSNVELQTMLKSISDPGQSYQSAIRIIQDIEDAYVTGNGTLPKKDQPAALPAAPQGTGGFKYLGKE